MCRSFSAEAHKKDWSKRLSLRGNPRISKEVKTGFIFLFFLPRFVSSLSTCRQAQIHHIGYSILLKPHQILPECVTPKSKLNFQESLYTIYVFQKSLSIKCFLLSLHFFSLFWDWIFVWFKNVMNFQWVFQQEKDANSRKGIARRSTSLRQSRSPQISLELQVPSLQSPIISSLTNATTTTPKKSNWEVIEHFNNAEKGRGSVSSSLIAVSFSHT